MNGADWVIVAILLLSLLVGLWRGLVREALALVTWLAAIAGALLFGGQVAQFYAAWIDLPSARTALGYGTVFVLVLVVGGLLGWLVARVVRAGGLGGTDRVLGLGFGLLRGGLVVAALVLVLGYTPFPQDPWWQQSELIPRFQPVATWLREQIPETLAALQALSPPVLPSAAELPQPPLPAPAGN
ncbi:MAG: CvpA family protein [Xanthomonadales bacterium]|nr:CvpA family protein [Xanthomonadales bacterium]